MHESEPALNHGHVDASEVAFAFRVTPAALLAGLGFAAVMGLVGGFLPALRAARQTPARSLRAL